MTRLAEKVRHYQLSVVPPRSSPSTLRAPLCVAEESFEPIYRYWYKKLNTMKQKCVMVQTFELPLKPKMQPKGKGRHIKSIPLLCQLLKQTHSHLKLLMQLFLNFHLHPQSLGDMNAPRTRKMKFNKTKQNKICMYLIEEKHICG